MKLLDHWIDYFRVPIRADIWLAALVVLMLASLAAHASSVVSWALVTEYTDGTPIPASDAPSYRVEWAKCAAGDTFPVGGEGSQLVPAGTSSATVPAAATPGRWCFRVFAITELGVQSDPSDTALKVVSPKKPNQPTEVGVTAL